MNNVSLKRTFTFLLLLSVIFVASAQAPHAFFKFANKPGYEFAILLFGAEKGEATLDWGEGSTQTITLDPKKGSFIKGKTLSKELTITGNIAAIECSGNEMTEIVVNTLPELSAFISRKNFTRKIDFSGNPKLKLLCIENSFLDTLDLSHNVALDTVLLTSNKLQKLVLPESAPNLKVLDCSSNFKLNELDLSQCTSLVRLQLHQTGITKLPLSQHASLQYLSAGLMKPITQLELPANNIIDTLFIPSAGLKSIDLSGCNRLKVLVVDNNWALGEINCSNLTELVSLNCIGTSISQLDVSKCEKLVILNCNNCAIESLDLSKNVKLEVLACFENALKELDVTNTKLENLDCSNNVELSRLALPATLKDLNCSACDLSELSFITPAIMESLVCSENKISKLDVSEMSELSALTCDNNNISSLQTGKLKSLLNLNVASNPIHTLDLSASPRVSYVKVDGTLLNACELNTLYESLRAIDQQSQSTGVYFLENNVENEAATSTTSIASNKGWTVTIPGDGTGCNQTGVNNIEMGNKSIAVRYNGSGWTVSGLPSQACVMKLYNLNGALVGRYNCSSSVAAIPSSVDCGIYVLIAEGVARTVSLNR